MLQILKEICLSIFIVAITFAVGVWFLDPTGREILNNWMDNYFTTGQKHVADKQNRRIMQRLYGGGTQEVVSW
ncbi:MAG: hypothetical protein PHQ23_05600 [Candidatus Wallbacteria bacterium]|nr:hypothetical protein [Candidatus Wallbacteria bacterium]